MQLVMGCSAAGHLPRDALRAMSVRGLLNPGGVVSGQMWPHGAVETSRTQCLQLEDLP